MEVWWIRHGESESNAGLRTESDRTNPLSLKGQAEALLIPDAFERAPSLVVTSPYIRTLQTALPLLRRFPQVPHEEWPVQEYTWLSTLRRRNTTSQERIPWAKAHFERFDPHLVDGEGAESFVGFMGRVEGAIERLRRLEHDFVAVFCHGAFIRALLWSQLNRPKVLDSAAMQKFVYFDMAVNIPNASITKMHLHGKHAFFSPPLVDHLERMHMEPSQASDA